MSAARANAGRMEWDGIFLSAIFLSIGRGAAAT
jgi:hypothetical protein